MKFFIMSFLMMIGLALAAENEKPNIVYFLVDDMGFSDCGFNGGKDIKTPNIDALAGQGVTFDNYYVQPMCSPTRACFLTGRLPNRHGVRNAYANFSKQGLPLNERTLAQALQSAGYSTAISGKWHIGHAKKGYLPLQRGFDQQYGIFHGMIDYYTHSHKGKHDWYRNDEPLNEEGYSTDLIVNDAVRVIREQSKDKPLFLYVSFNAVHTPYQAPEEYLERYADKGLTPERQMMAAMLSSVDDGIGRVIDALEKAGMRENTILIFSSDNGGYNYDLYTDNRPLRDGKHSIYEGGVRSCAFAVWPGHIPAGRVVKDMVHIVDWYPTLIKIAGGSLEQPLPIDGLDILPVLKGEASLDRDTLLIVGTHPQKDGNAIRIGDWKLLIWPDGRTELYNLKNDIGEKTNLAASEPERVERMTARLKTMMKNS